MITFSHMIFYVKDIPQALAFYKSAFELDTKFLHESGQYAELDTGQTSLAFASEELGELNLPEGFTPNGRDRLPAGCEVAFTADDVESAYKKALANGAIDVAAPVKKPWGQVVAYVRDPNGVVVEIGSKMES